MSYSEKTEYSKSSTFCKTSRFQGFVAYSCIAAVHLRSSATVMCMANVDSHC